MDIIRLDQDFTRWDDLLALIHAAFAYMNGRIDPPSSAFRMTPAALAEKAQAEIGYVACEGDALLGCVFLRPEADSLYLGRLAVSPQAQGRGLGRALLAQAEATAQALGLAALRLNVRAELTGNQATFAGWGFVRTAGKSHAGYDRITQYEMRKTLARPA